MLKMLTAVVALVLLAGPALAHRVWVDGHWHRGYYYEGHWDQHHHHKPKDKPKVELKVDKEIAPLLFFFWFIDQQNK